MRLAPVNFLSQEELIALKPAKGDVVSYQGTKYVVDEVGLKYLHMHLESNPKALGFAKIQEVSKWFPEEPESAEETEMKTPLVTNKEFD